MAPFVCRGVLLDIAAYRGVTCLNDGDVLGPADLEAVERAQQTPVRSGDAVLVRTGRGQYWDDPPRYFHPSRSDPGPGAAGVDWLYQRRIAITGSDTVAYEAITPDLAEFGKGHIQLLNAGIPIVENLNLEPLSEAGVREFLFVMSPLKIVGGTGSPVRPVAIAL
jgi:kynurenine formamidase